VDDIIDIPLPGQPLSYKQATDGKSNSRPVMHPFVAGPENKLVETAILTVLERPGHIYNPLVLYGPSGTGKSHLALGLAAEWRVRYGHRSVEYTTAVDFARQFTEALATQAVEDFQIQYRKAPLVIIEDIDELIHKQSPRLNIQEELIHTLAALTDWDRQVVITSSRAPSQLRNLLPGLQSRLIAGLEVPLLPPARETRKAILQRLAERRGIQLPKLVVGALAEGLHTTVPELYGALTQLEVQAHLDGGTIEMSLVHRYLTQRKQLQKPPLRDIAATTAQFFSLNLSDLRSRSRRRIIVTARAVAIYLARQLTRASFQQIGKYFGGRDHTTIIYNYQKLKTTLEKDPAMREAIQELQAKWGDRQS